MALVLAGLKVEDLHWDLLIALVVGVVVALGLGSSVPNLLFRTIGDALALDVDLGARPLLVGVALVAVVGLVVGLVVGAKMGGARGAIGGLVAFALAGALAGAFLAVDFGWRVGIALGVATLLVVWPVGMGVRVKRSGLDAGVLKARFIPQQSIDAAKETIEWAKDHVPGAPL